MDDDISRLVNTKDTDRYTTVHFITASHNSDCSALVILMTDFADPCWMYIACLREWKKFSSAALPLASSSIVLCGNFEYRTVIVQGNNSSALDVEHAISYRNPIGRCHWIGLSSCPENQILSFSSSLSKWEHTFCIIPVKNPLRGTDICICVVCVYM